MENYVEDFFAGLNCPVIVTDPNDLVIYKNGFAKKYLRTPRKGDSILRYVNSGGVNVLDRDGLVSLNSVFGGACPYQRALVFRTDASPSPEAKLWIFDQLLFLLRPDQIRGFLAGAARTLAPILIPLIKDGTGIKFIPRPAEWKEPLRALCGYFYSLSGELEAASSFCEFCPADRLTAFLKNSLAAPAERAGFPVLFRYECDPGDLSYIDYTFYYAIFVRLFILALEHSEQRRAELLIRCDGSECSTLISCVPKLPKKYPEAGGFDELRKIIPGDDLNVALAESLFEYRPSCKFSFEVSAEKTFPVTLRFDIPAERAPRILRQDERDPSNDPLPEAEDMLSKLLSAVTEN